MVIKAENRTSTYTVYLLFNLSQKLSPPPTLGSLKSAIDTNRRSITVVSHSTSSSSTSLQSLYKDRERCILFNSPTSNNFTINYYCDLSHSLPLHCKRKCAFQIYRYFFFKLQKSFLYVLNHIIFHATEVIS